MQALSKHATFVSRCAIGTAIVFTFLVAATARAATYTWDPDQTTTGSDDSGSGANWSAGGYGPYYWANGTADVAWNSSTGGTDTAVFGVGGAGSYTVGVQQTVGVGGITFNSGAYTLQNNYNGAINLNLPAVPIVVNNGATPSITVAMSGTGGISVSGGSLTLGNPGSSTQSNFTGNVSISNGTVSLVGYGYGIPSIGTSPLGNPTTVGQTVTINNGGVLQFGNNSNNILGGPSPALAVTIVLNSGGSVIGAPAYDMYNDGRGNTLGNLVLNGGTLTTGAGVYDYSQQSFYLSGGSVSVTAPSVINTDAGARNGLNLASTTTFNVASTGGSPDLSVGVGLFDPPTSSGGSATLVKTGAGFMQLNAASSYSGGTRVSAGTLQLNNLAALGSSSGPLTANGGVLDLNGFSPTVGQFSGANGTVLTSSGGPTLTTNMPSGSSTTFGGTLSDGQGQLSLTVGGSGKLTLAGNNTYTGPTNIGGGSLYLTGSAAGTTITVAGGAALGGWGSAPSASVYVNDGGILDFTPKNTAGTSLTLSSLTFNGGATINLSDSGGQYNSIPAVNAPSLTTASTINVNVTNLPMGSGTVEIAQYSGLIGGSGDSVFNLASPVSSGTATYSLVDTGSYIDLTYSTTSPTAGALYWTGTGDGNWNTTSPHAWNAASGGPATYQDGNAVLFDNRGSAGTTVNVNAANVMPASVTFSNSGAVSYTLTGSYGIAGSASVTVNGGGLVTFRNNNPYTGSTTITAGTLAIGGGGSLGGGNYAAAISNAGLLNYNGTANQTFSGQISGGGALAQNGPGTLTLAGSNTYNGPTAINGGVLNVGAAENPGVAGPLGVGGAISFGGGTLQYSASNQYDYSSRFSTAAGQNYRIDTNDQSVTLGTSLTSSNGTLTKLGNGTLTVAGSANSYSGPTIVAGGVLMLGTITANANAPSSAIGVKFPYDGSTFASYNVSGTAGAPGGVISGWNNPNWFSQGPNTDIPVNYNTGSASGATVNYNPGTFGGGNSVYHANQSNQDVQLMNAFLTAFSGGQSVTFSNIPYANYSLYAYLTSPVSGIYGTASVGGTTYYFSTDAFSGGMFTGYTPITSTDSSNYAPGDYVVFSGLSGSSLTFSDSMANSSGAGIAAIEIVPVSTSAATLPSTTALQMGSGIFDLNGGSQQVASLSDYAAGGGSIINSNTGALAALIVSPTGTTTSYSGSILGVTGGSNGDIALVLNGNGTQVLSGTNTYTGGTWVENGTLIATNNEAIDDGSNLYVGSNVSTAFGSLVAAEAPAGAAVATAVPEPAALDLLASVAAIAALGATGKRVRWRRRG